MKISTKGRYGLRALVDLASQSQDTAVSLVQIAERQKISLNYLEQVFGVLRKAEIVKSQKGAQGGYLLAVRPEEITVSQVITALEGRFAIIGDIPSEGQDEIQRTIQEMVWDKINESVNTYLESITIAQLVEHYKNLCSESIMYYI